MTRDELREKLSNIKIKIIECKSKLIILTESKKEVGEQISEIKKIISLEIAEEVDPFGKTMFSNQVKRDGELFLRLSEHSKYNTLLDDYSRLEKEIGEYQLILESAQYDFRIEEILSRYCD